MPTVHAIPDVSASGSDTVVNPAGGVFRIEQGIRNGDNLFHSFEAFSPEDINVIFDNPFNVKRIFGRVLGSSESIINSTISIDGSSADLFLINPNGFTFGSNARLDPSINSFSATTATSILFPDAEFTTLNPDPAAPLSVQIPTALKFQLDQGRITIQGTGHHLTASSVQNLASGSTITNTLGVGTGQTLTLVGNGVEFQGGNIFADGGRIEVGSVGANSQVNIINGSVLDYRPVQTFQDIQLTNAASIDASGAGGGAIQVQGNNISLKGGSNIIAITEGANPGQDILISATGQLSLNGFSGSIPTGITTRNDGNTSASTGSSGNITVNANRVLVDGGAQVATGTFRLGGQAGDLTVNAATTQLNSNATTTTFGPSGLLSRVRSASNGGAIALNGKTLLIENDALISTRTIRAGASGSIRLELDDQIQVQNGGLITASTLIRGGEGGDIFLSSDRLRLDNSRILTITDDDSVGAAGNITAQVNQLQLLNESEISTSTFTMGNAGDITITAEEMQLTDKSLIASQVGQSLPPTTGNGGTIQLDTQTLIIESGSQVLADTRDQGNSGSISVVANESVTIRGTGINSQGNPVFSGIQTQVNPSASGNAGTTRITTKFLTLENGGAISSGTSGSGSGGSVDLDVADTIIVQGTENGLVSGISARTRAERDAGNVSITTSTLQINDQGTVTVESLGTGNAGNLTVNARYIRLNNNASITGSTTSGQGGNLTLSADHIVMLFDSEIATTAGTANQPGDGGNITIAAATVTGLFNSDIASNSFQGRGGRIVITAQGIFGLEFRLVRTAENDITAISLVNPELNGEVVLNTPDIDPTQALIEIPVVESPEVVERVCTVRPGMDQATGQFAVSGLAVPAGPQGVSSSVRGSEVGAIAPFSGANEPIRAALITATPIASQPTSNPLIAQGWGINAQGQVVLTAEPTADPVQGMLVSAVRCG
jgi:filamentous hemagglutinin family protein